MRNFPNNFADFFYLVEKVGLAPLRGLLVWPRLARASAIPFLGHGVKVISKHKLTVGRLVWIGQGCYLDCASMQGVYLCSGVTIRENSTIQCRGGLHDIGEGLVIREGTFIGPCAKIGVGGEIKIGSNCQIGAHCTFNAESHAPIEGDYTRGKTSRSGIKIGNNVWMGDRVTVLDGVNVGDRAVLGAGAVVNKDVPAGEVYAGIPAKRIRSSE
ncbi:acyltransferase [Gammaproteobacteria bacterium]|nr:acyltransferase [Gammaproteobacteria bacterium]